MFRLDTSHWAYEIHVENLPGFMYNFEGMVGQFPWVDASGHHACLTLVHHLLDVTPETRPPVKGSHSLVRLGDPYMSSPMCISHQFWPYGSGYNDPGIFVKQQPSKDLPFIFFCHAQMLVLARQDFELISTFIGIDPHILVQTQYLLRKM